ncbi:hypothetical protein HBA55_36985, partial [Pseudomaricurvus alkylphenolicus]|uniref:beta strand repeat-containing protein n=1 Tax=Pseudomaricurvus alkylphenolicus TaxID=1306991 RepID=UPI0014233C1F
DTDVTVVFTNGSAEDSDYDGRSQTVTISSGASTATLTVDTHEDADFDNDTFTASIQSVEDTGQFEAIDTTNGADGQTPSQLTTIQDNDTAPTIRIDDVTVNEDAGTATFTVSLSHATTEAVTFDFATSDDSATAGADYTANSGNGSIGAGDTETTITVAITDDFLKEGDETYNVTLSNLSANVAATGNDLLGVGTITDAGSETDDPETVGSADTVYAVISGSATVTEGATTTDYTVSLIDAGGNAVTVNADTDVTVVFTNGSAEDGDYDATSQTVTISSGASTATLTVDTNEDADFDNDTFTASIQSVEDTGQFEAIDTTNGADGQTPSQLTTIQDNDTAPTIRIDDVTVNEDAGTATFTVSLSHATTEAVTFDFATSDDSATAGADYTANSGNGSIGAGETETTITVAITDDFLKEGDETYDVTLSNLSANVAAAGNDLVGVGTITDAGSETDDPETVGSADTVYAVISGPTTVTEGATTTDYTVSLIDASGNAVTVNADTDVTVVFTNGSAEVDDYDATSQTVTISSGASTTTLTVDTHEDADFDNETFTASIQSVEDTGQFEAIDTTNGADGQTPSQLTTIQDDDTAPTIRINDVTVNEDAGTATFTVSLSHATTEAVSFDFATSDDSATAGADYTANSGNGSIGAGETQTTLTVAITDDFLKEGDETYNVTLSNLSANVAATGNDLVGVGTITDAGSETDDPETVDSADTVYAVISGPATVTEGSTTTDYTVSLIDAGGNAVTVNADTDVTVVFTSGSAEDGDYDGRSQTVTISSGAISTTLTVDTHEDADFDNETFTASIHSVDDTGQFEAIDTSTGADGQTPSQLTTIQDNDTAPTIRINDVTVNEDAGTATFTVSLSHATTEAVTFDFATSDDSATAGADYTANSGNGSIGAGDTETTITVAITDDFLKEGDETYDVTLLNLSANVAATGNDLVGVGTITDAGSETDDPEDTTSADTVYAVISGPATVTEGATTTDYTVSLIDAGGNAVTVNADTDVTVVFTNGSAEDSDYDGRSQTVTISSGASTATLTVDTHEDADFDNDTFTASIQSVDDTGQFEAIDTTNGADGQTPSQLTTIQDNDTAPTIRIDDVTVNEDAGTATFTVSLSHATTEAVTFDFATSDDSATAGADYTANSGNGSIGAGDTDTTITVAITDDFLKEGDETYDVTLSNLSANVAAAGNDLVGVGTITDAGSETDDPEDTTSADTVYAVISGPATVTEGA